MPARKTALNPAAAKPPARERAVSRAASHLATIEARYDAAGQGRRTRGWNAPATGPRTATQGLETIRSRANDTVRNDWSGESSVQKWATTLVGIGITPFFEKESHRKLWDAFAKKSDADCVLNFYAQQALVTRAWLTGGEVFARRRPRDLSSDLPVPLQVQLIEGDYVPVFDADVYEGMPAGNVIRQGIELNRRGQRRAVWIYRDHPGDKPNGAMPLADKLVRVPISDILHVYEVKRPGQLRGVSPFAPVLMKLRGALNMEDAVLERQLLANLFVLFITRQLPDNWEDSLAINPDTGLPKIWDNDGSEVVDLQPGTSQELRPGEDVKFANPPEAGASYPDYMRTSHLGTSAGQGLPYELMTGDIKDISDRALRIIIQEFRRFASQRQWHTLIPQFCEGVCNWWAAAAVLAGKLPLSEFEQATSPEWVPHGWDYIHPTQDAQGKKTLIELGVVSRRSVQRANGDDSRTVLKERLKDAEDDAKVAGATPRPPEPAPTPGPAPKALADFMAAQAEVNRMLAEQQTTILAMLAKLAPTEGAAS